MYSQSTREVGRENFDFRKKHDNYGYFSPKFNHLNEKHGAFECFSPNVSHGNHGNDESNYDFLDRICIQRVKGNEEHDKPYVWNDVESSGKNVGGDSKSSTIKDDSVASILSTNTSIVNELVSFELETIDKVEMGRRGKMEVGANWVS